MSRCFSSKTLTTSLIAIYQTDREDYWLLHIYWFSQQINTSRKSFCWAAHEEDEKMIYGENILTDCGLRHLAGLLHLSSSRIINNIPTSWNEKKKKNFLDYKNVVCHFGSSKSVLERYLTILRNCFEYSLIHLWPHIDDRVSYIKYRNFWRIILIFFFVIIPDVDNPR